MYYSMKGFVYSVCLAILYLILVIAFTSEAGIISQALVRVVIFIVIAGIVTFLSIRRKAAERRVQESEETFRSLFEGSADPVLLLNEKGFVDCNPAVVAMLGCASKEEVVNKLPWDFSPLSQPDGKLSSDKAMEMMRLANHNGHHRFEWVHLRSDSSELLVEAMLTPVVIRDKQFLHVVWRDITERKRIEETLKRSESMLSDIIDFLPDATFVIDRKGKVVAWNLAMEEMTGVSKKDMVGQGDHAYSVPFYGKRRQMLLDIIGMSDDDLKTAYKGVERVGNIIYGEAFAHALNGGRGAHTWGKAAEFFDDSGNPVGAIETIRDITERKLAEDKIRSLLSEKELLLKEVHHRIKNNMNVIMSLLSLQAGTMKDQLSIAALEDSRSRIQGMMVLYDKLYRSSDYRTISTKAYLTSLVNEIAGTFPNRGQVEIGTRIHDVAVDAKVLSPVGIIVNELLTNAMKHAFTGRDGGKIDVCLSIKDGYATLIIEDDGNGIPRSVGIGDPAGFGLQLVGILTEQLEGTIQIERGIGTKFIINFGL